MFEEIYQKAFEDELSKIAGVTRFNLAGKSLDVAKNYLEHEQSLNKDDKFRRTKLFKKWNKSKRREFKALKKYWRKRSISTEIMGI